MKLLHTSDLHLGALWRGTSRRPDQERVLEEILGLCDRHNVDVLLVTGDVFSDRVEATHADVAHRFLERLRSHLRRGRGVFLLRGNHDPLPLFHLMRLLVAELAGPDRWPLVVADLPAVYRVPGHALQVVALPYVGPNWLQQQASGFDLSPEQRIAGLAGLLAQCVEQLYRQASPTLPAIFTAHIQLQGANITQDLEVESGYHRELWLEPGRLPQFTSYNALGHIHLSQEIRGAGKPTWYAGAPDRVDLGERDYRPQVLVVSLPDTPGGSATVEPVPLASCTPFVRETLVGAEAVERFCTSVGTPDPLGDVTIAEVPVASRAAIDVQIRRVAPRVRIQWALEEQPRIVAEEARVDPDDVPATVRAYLERAYAEQPERRARLEAAFAALWSEVQT